MARLPIQSVESAAGSNKDIFAPFQEALGTVPHMARVMANSPVVLQGYAQFSGAMAGAKLSARIREEIALLTAASNACAYCLSANSVLGKMAGLNQAQIDGARTRESSDPRTSAALKFAQAVIDLRGGIGDGDDRAIRAPGFSDEV